VPTHAGGDLGGNTSHGAATQALLAARVRVAGIAASVGRTALILDIDVDRSRATLYRDGSARVVVCKAEEPSTLDGVRHWDRDHPLP
jgi:hypothetical protein